MPVEVSASRSPSPAGSKPSYANAKPSTGTSSDRERTTSPTLTAVRDSVNQHQPGNQARRPSASSPSFPGTRTTHFVDDNVPHPKCRGGPSRLVPPGERPGSSSSASRRRASGPEATSLASSTSMSRACARNNVAGTGQARPSPRRPASPAAPQPMAAWPGLGLDQDARGDHVIPTQPSRGYSIASAVMVIAPALLASRPGGAVPCRRAAGRPQLRPPGAFRDRLANSKANAGTPRPWRGAASTTKRSRWRRAL